MKKGVLLTSVLGICLGIGTFSTVQSANVTEHTFYNNSVDSRIIAWTSTTKYTSYRDNAINTWNALGKVKIQPDTAYTANDLIFSDENLAKESHTGRWIYKMFGADYLKFNIPRFSADYRTTKHKNKTATHELGHALGLGDHYNGYSTQVMWGTESEVNTLQTHEKADYNNWWK